MRKAVSLIRYSCLWAACTFSALCCPCLAERCYAPRALDRLNHVFRQTFIQSEDKIGTPFNAHGVTGIYKDYLLLSGFTKTGKKWSLKLDPVMANYEIWEADFDLNGVPDLAIRLPTGGCGYACSGRIVLLMFDKNRKPRLFEGFSTGLSSEGAEARKGTKPSSTVPGLQDIYRPQSGGAILTLTSLEHGGDRSYWRTSAWQAKNGGWTELHNVYGARLPSYVWFTNKCNHKSSPAMSYLGDDAASKLFEAGYGDLDEREEFTIK